MTRQQMRNWGTSAQIAFGVMMGALTMSGVRAGLPGDVESTFQLDPSLVKASRIAGAAAASDGRLLVVWVGENGPRLSRLNALGGVDGAFLSSALSGFAPGMLTQLSDGRILCGSFPYAAQPMLGKVQRFHADGTLDDSFGFERTLLSMSSMVSLPSGEVLLGAKFEPTTDFSPSLYLHRLTSAGLVDPGFVVTGAFAAFGELRHVMRQGDGSLVIAGPIVARLGVNGVEDMGFGARTLRGRTDAAFMLPDGRMLFAGRYEGTNGLLKSQIMRFLPSGDIDSSFVITEYEGEAHRMTALSDGRVLIGGAIARIGGIGRRGLGRLLPNGGVDTGFVCHLAPNTPLAGGPLDVRVDGLGVRSDGRVFVTGQFQSVNGVSVSGPVAVLEMDSKQDGPPQIVGLPEKLTLIEGRTLELSARVISGTSTTSEWRSASGVISGATLPEYHRRNTQRSDAGIYELVVRNDSGTASKSVTVQVLMGTSKAGSVDVSFDVGAGAGPLKAAPGSIGPKLFVAAGVGDRVFLAGDFNQFGDAPRSRVIAMRGDGSVDESFVWPKDVATFLVREVGAILPLPDGKLLVGMNMSRTANGPMDRSAVGRFLPNGSRDETFKNGDLQLSPARISTLCVDSKGRVLVGRRLTTTPLARLELSSRLDPEFQPPQFLAAPGDPLEVRTILALPNGQLLVGGTFVTVDGKSTGGLVRLEESGVLDTAFHAVLNPDLKVVSAAGMPDGKILVGLNGAPGVVRLLPDGAVDTGFQTPAFLGAIQHLVVDEVGRLLVVPGAAPEESEPLRPLMRLLSTGAVDPEFELEPELPSVLSVAVDGSDRVLVAGDFTELSATERATVVRLHGADDRILHMRRDGKGGPVIHWNSRLERTYWIERSSIVGGGVWTQTLGLPGTGKPVEFTEPTREDGSYFRIRIE